MEVPPLDARFSSYIRCLPGSINMDGTDGFKFASMGRSRCDYFLNTPETLVCISLLEQKTLKTVNFSDEELAFANIVNSAAIESDGVMRLDLSDIDARAVQRLVKRIAGYLGDANRQIRETARSMPLPVDSYNGFLVVLNELVKALSFKVLNGLCRIALGKKDEAGVSQYPHVNGVIIVDETARLKGVRTSAVIYEPSKLNQRDDADKIGLEIAKVWGELSPSNGAQSVIVNSQSFLLKKWGEKALLNSMLRSTVGAVDPEGWAVDGTLMK